MAFYSTDHRGQENAYILKETICNENTQKRYETVMCLGNGYMGMRSAFCETERNQDRLTLIAGLYDRQPSEEEELAPLPDVTPISLQVNGKEIGPLHEGAMAYQRSLNLENGLLSYSYDYAPEGQETLVSVSQRRFVSMEQKHLAVFETVIRAHQQVQVEATASINARQTVDGTQHFFEEERTVLPGHLLWYGGRTVSSETAFKVGVRVKVFLDGQELPDVQRYATTRRLVSTRTGVWLNAGSELRIVRYALFYTQHDPQWGNLNGETITEQIKSEMDRISVQSFSNLLRKSEEEWTRIWHHCDITVQSGDESENLKIRLAMYHMVIMCPAHDNRVSVAAKGLTGMKYAGHVFWDCEIFNLPFFTYTAPESARSICTYRYHTLEGAQNKAKSFGFAGAMYPWESASQKGDEQSPHFKNYSPDNTPRRVTCGDIEHHVVCDVAYGIYEYARVTGDQEFMESCGLQILFETADFWQSRLDYISQKDRYEILQVTGPDEYKEYVDNDAFTNYMVAWNLRTALMEGEKLRRENPILFAQLNASISLSRIMDRVREKLPKLYLPAPNEEGLIPQNDTYLSLKRIDLTKYKTSSVNRLIYQDYSLREIGQLMVSKQADLIQLMALMPKLFDKEVVMRNFDFYEDKCIHDSTLSKSTYALAAQQMGDTQRAYHMLQDALNIDFGENATLCEEGIHAANCGGIWQTVVFGFAGVSVMDQTLHLQPVLPDEWDQLSIRLFWHGCELNIQIDKCAVTVEVMNGVPVSLNVCGQELLLKDHGRIEYVH